jgi:fermentation-respiration switch protein FrsA (DUF1100 family)
MSSEPKTQPPRSPAARAWRFARPFVVGYLIILLGMLFLETKLVYPIPPLSWGNWKPIAFTYEDVLFTSADDTLLNGWLIPRENSKHAVLYCHGNGEDIANVGDFAAELGQALDATVFIFDYRGYGHSAGSPTEAGCIADGCAAQEWLAQKMGIKPNEVVLIGRSLGSAVAVGIAAENGARALVLDSAFATMPDVAALHYPWLPVRWIMKNRYDNLTRIHKYNGPVLQVHGSADSLIPISQAKLLFDAVPNPDKMWVTFDGLDHNHDRPSTWYKMLASFLKTAGGSK